MRFVAVFSLPPRFVLSYALLTSSSSSLDAISVPADRMMCPSVDAATFAVSMSVLSPFKILFTYVWKNNNILLSA